MLAIQAPSGRTLMTPALRDRPGPTAMVKSASAPRPKISRLPSATFTTSPDGVLTCAVTEVAGWIVIGWSLALATVGAVAAMWSLGRDAMPGSSPISGICPRANSGLAGASQGEGLSTAIGGDLLARSLSPSAGGWEPRYGAGPSSA